VNQSLSLALARFSGVDSIGPNAELFYLTVCIDAADFSNAVKKPDCTIGPEGYCLELARRSRDFEFPKDSAGG